MTDWTAADDQRLKVALTKAVVWLGRVFYRGHCPCCEEQGQHEINCPLVAVRTRLQALREEERLITVNAISKRARDRARAVKPERVYSQTPDAQRLRRQRAMRKTA